jgi:hypothetical protein
MTSFIRADLSAAYPPLDDAEEPQDDDDQDDRDQGADDPVVAHGAPLCAAAPLSLSTPRSAPA